MAEGTEMGPIALFDKSFLQSLSLDESVWFDHFFLANICPLFYVETLADLEKAPRSGSSAEQEVQIIAKKFPEVSGAPCVHHRTLCLSELFGRPVPLTGQIPLSHGRCVKANGRMVVLYEQAPEADAFLRWQKGQFIEIERYYAVAWRRALSSLRLPHISEMIRRSGRKPCRTLEEALALAKAIITGKPSEDLDDLMNSNQLPRESRAWVLDCWIKAGSPPMAQYAPYACHVMLVDMFFTAALSASLISDQRPSNRVDMAYLYYLPFCQVFISSDRLHKRCASHFMRPDQCFVWGPELKKDLTMLNEYYLCFPTQEREKGIMSFAPRPPTECEFLVSAIWDRFSRRWRQTPRP